MTTVLKLSEDLLDSFNEPISSDLPVPVEDESIMKLAAFSQKLRGDLGSKILIGENGEFSKHGKPKNKTN